MPTVKASASASEQRRAREPGGERRDGRRADDDAGGVGRDHRAGLRERVLGRRARTASGSRSRAMFGQQPHGDELGRADAEAAEGEGEQREAGARGREWVTR